MKKLLLFSITFYLIQFKSEAQTEKGRWMTGSQIGNFSYRKRSSNSHYFSMDMAPSAGYFISHNFALGLSIPIITSTLSSSNYLHKEREMGIAPFALLYFGNGKLKPYLSVLYKLSKERTYHEAGVDFGNTNYESISRNSTWSPGVGVAYFITKGIAVNAIINYNSYNRRVDNNGGRYSGKDATLHLGFNVFFGKTEK